MATAVTRVERFDAYQRRHNWLGFALAVVYKAFDDRAPYLAALVTYYSFVSLFPLILLFVSVAGFVLQTDPHLRQEVVNSAVGNLPGIGSELRKQIGGFKGSGAAIVVGVVGLLYGALGATQAAQAAFNQIYSIPRNEQPNPIRSRVRSLGLLLLLGTAVIVSSGINILVSTGNSVSAQLGAGLRVGGFIVSLAINLGLFTLAFQLLTAKDLRVRDVLTGGVIAGAAWQLLQTFGSQYVAHEVHHGGALYGVFGVVLATLAYVYIEALFLMLSAEINVVLQRRLWPRSLLTPFTDDVELTAADEEAYSGYVRAQRFKGWQKVEVRFPRRDREPEPGGGFPDGPAGGSGAAPDPERREDLTHHVRPGPPG
ncbi:MAG TPA: YihY/virulence factor BrkB family protein [Acidimicrobiales bacterium]|nr:YihY/virulence factor BrkB family protein [Acidimicrobiales bacterium]